jgi:NAD(P)-dependent dehydrogenase (short-subunit alcohol dehydrogenase family)
MTGTAVITGATGAIGSKLAELLAARGFSLVLAARTPEPLDALASRLGARAFPCDVTEPEQVAALLAAAAESGQPIKAVAHCVGSVFLKPLHLTTDTDWRGVMRQNLDSAYLVLRESVKAMRKEGGAVVLSSSAAARVGLSNHEAIAAAKGGIESLVASAAATYAHARVRINCVAPGLVRSAMTERITGNPASLKVSTEMHPLGRIGEGADVARAMAFLLDPDQSWITGQVLGVDGGLGTIKSR